MISDAAMQARTARVLAELLVDADRTNAPVLNWRVDVGRLSAITHDQATFDAWAPIIDAEPEQNWDGNRQVWVLSNVAADATVHVVVTLDRRHWR